MIIIITLHSCIRGKVIGCVIIVVHKNLLDIEIYQAISTIMMSKLALKCASICSSRPTSATKSVFLLAIVATPIDLAHHM